MFAGQPTVNTEYIDARLACILTTTFHGHKEMKGSIAGIMKHVEDTKGTYHSLSPISSETQVYCPSFCVLACSEFSSGLWGLGWGKGGISPGMLWGGDSLKDRESL